MSGKGRAFDNIMIERLWRALKYEEVYLKEYTHYYEALNSIKGISSITMRDGVILSLGNRIPREIYLSGKDRDREGAYKTVMDEVNGLARNGIHNCFICTLN